MSDRHAEGIEKAAEELFYLSDIGGAARAHWETVITEARDYYRTRSRASIAAYLEQAFPEVTSAEELDALPVGTIIRDADGDACQKDSDEEVQWWRILCIEDGWSSEEIHLPARVIWWGDQ